MPKINPAYKDPNYLPFPTPIPDESTTIESPENEAGEEVGENEEPKAEEEAEADADAEDDKASDEAMDQGDDEELNFEGDSIQLAQDKIISELIPLRDDQYESADTYFSLQLHANYSQRKGSRRPLFVQAR